MRLHLLPRLPRSTTLVKTVVAQFDRESAPYLLKCYHRDHQRWSWTAYHGQDVDDPDLVETPQRDADGHAVLDDAENAVTQPAQLTVPMRKWFAFSRVPT